ncbi:MAG: methylated-DNA--[protein]-cysteine S-methyltransferase [Bryobacteraceae bacterium]
MTRFTLDRIPFEAGTILLVSTPQAVCALDYEGFEARMHRLLDSGFGPHELAPGKSPFRAAIVAYLAGDTRAVDRVPVDAPGTDFQRLVWNALRQIPPGQTATYGALAVHLGRPNAARAVGLANSLNPIAIIQPCHRVVGANGKLTGYAGGLAVKEWLLRHEGVC